MYKIDKIKIVVTAVIVFGLITVGTVSTNVFAKDVDYKLAHQELDQVLQDDLDYWINTTAVKRFCMPKADLIQKEIVIRAELGDSLTDLQARKDKVIQDCKGVVKDILFR